MGDKIRFGIIGIGGTIGSTTRILADEKNAELVALADPDSNRREGTLDEIEGVQIFDDYKEMLQQAELDAVCIGLPTWMHAPATRDALECGLHGMCEKPPANSAEEMKPLANETPPTHNNCSRCPNEIPSFYPSISLRIRSNETIEQAFIQSQDKMERMRGSRIGCQSCL